MENFSFIDILLCFILGFSLGEMYCAWQVHKIIRNILIKHNIETESLIEDEVAFSVAKLQIERVDTQLFLYEYDTNHFICQADTVEELAKRCKEYKNISNAVVLDSNNIIFFIDGVVQQKS
jgi:hypothetical protein